MQFGSVCSGIEAASAGWNPLGWQARFFSEIEKFPCALLQHHYPEVPNYGDMTNFKEWKQDAIDVLIGGTPCQSFSVAGLRKGLADPRGDLMLTFGAIASKYRPQWLVWENVPGVLSSDGGRDFGTFLGMLGELGYGYAYRVLDAQYFGVAQRRKRVFVVANSGDWRLAAAVLFERHSLSGNPAPSREKGESTAHDVAPSLVGSGRSVERIGETRGQDPVIAMHQTVGTLCSDTHPGCYSGQDAYTGRLVPVRQPIAHTLRSKGFDASEDGTGRGTPIVPVTLPINTQISMRHKSMAVRRLTPRECERLQGFHDDYTLVPYRGKPAADGPRYKAIGNSMAVPVMRWIGERIEQVSGLVN